MTTSERLLLLVSRLQREGNSTFGRRALLKYIRESSGAQLAVLFRLDRERHVFRLLTYTGLRPASSYRSSSRARKGDKTSSDPRHIPLNGLFGRFIDAPGLHYFADLYTHVEALLQERAWAVPGGTVILIPIKAGSFPEDAQGMLMLSFAAVLEPGEKDEAAQQQNLTSDLEGGLLVCATLLSTYLIQPEKATEKLASTRFYRSRVLHRAKGEQVLATLLQAPSELQVDFNEMKYDLMRLSELYEIGLVSGLEIEITEFYQHLLIHLCNSILASSACLLRYISSSDQFKLVAMYGEGLPCQELAKVLDAVLMERIALRGPGETLTTVQLGEHLILLAPLSHNCSLVGVVAFSGVIMNQLVPEQMLLLSYLCNIAALLIHNMDLQLLMRQALIDHERSRIARELHDTMAQQMGFVLQKLELIQYLLEKPFPVAQQVLNEVKRSYALLEEVLDDLREGISALVPIQLQEESFDTAIGELIEQFKRDNPQIAVEFEHDALERISSELEIVLYRFIQEALNNIRKHAYATHVKISLDALPTMITVEVSDNGIGFQVENVLSRVGAQDEKSEARLHLGLRAMRERVQESGGYWELQSEPGMGTTVRAHFSLEKQTVMLTNRERDVLRLVVQGLTNRDIAERLSVSMETVKSHVRHILQKMQVKDRTQAAVVAIRQGWL